MLAAKSPTQQTAHTDHMSTCAVQTPVAPLPLPQGHVQLGDEDGGDGGAHHHPQAPGHRRHHGPPSLPSLHRSAALFPFKETNLTYDVRTQVAGEVAECCIGEELAAQIVLQRCHLL